MKKIILGILIGLTVLAIYSVATAGMLIPVADQAKENGKAPENSAVIETTESDEWDLERVDFIHYVKPVNPGARPKSAVCYKLLGVKWTTLPVSYVINPINPDGLTPEFIENAVSTSAETWDNATSSELFNTPTIDDTAQYGVQNYKNAIVFGDYPKSNVIAVTSIWFTRIGKRIVEFDILFNTDFDWGDATANSALMDLQNIATHELGHGAGLADIYSTSCSEVTMYGYSTLGETQKRTLENADILGIQKLYGGF